ncbi:MAG: PaREP1 family protein [Thermofilum sp.]|uniref:PaREP1/PaREP8 domain-contain protein n=1 Tax=Thermofilum adornatum 1505 TaxID=697581 RepID=A0A3G1A4X3_9CREN|nr:PaREP1 family protein [Thermofilum adornatum]AJB41760.1 PaREP1/PaREP8 domain-contain protein [Thermofilum adornatum 1505]
MELELVLSREIKKKLGEVSVKMEISIEGLALDAFKGMNEGMDPAERAELYLRLSEKYLKDGEELLAKGDCVQASEKLWGSAALMVKALAASRSVSVSSHGELFSYVRRLGEELGSPELRRLFSVASTLHQNFYENWLSGDVVREYAEDVKQLVWELKKLVRF